MRMTRVGTVLSVVGCCLLFAPPDLVACGFRSTGRIGVAQSARHAARKGPKAPQAPQQGQALLIYRQAVDAAFEGQLRGAGYTVKRVLNAEELKTALKDAGSRTVLVRLEEVSQVKTVGLPLLPIVSSSQVEAAQAQGHRHVLDREESAEAKLDAIKRFVSGAVLP